MKDATLVLGVPSMKPPGPNYRRRAPPLPSDMLAGPEVVPVGPTDDRESELVDLFLRSLQPLALDDPALGMSCLSCCVLWPGSGWLAVDPPRWKRCIYGVGGSNTLWPLLDLMSDG